MRNYLKQNTEQRRNYILQGPIFSTILLLSIPSLMMGIIQSIIPLIDGLFINNIAGTDAASAVTFCIPIVNIFVGLAQGLSSAGMAMIGQANGKGNLAEGRRISTQMIVFSCLLGVGLSPVLYALAYPITAGVNPEISQNVFRYLTLSGLVIPFTFMESIYNAIQNANGKPEATFIRMVILLVLKIAFNTLFVAVLRMDITGAVMASLASNILVTAWMFWELFVKESSDRLQLGGFKFDREILRDLLTIGTPAMISGVVLNLGFYLINSEVQKYGATVLNGQGIANNISCICFIAPSSFGTAVTAMVSMNTGAGDISRAKKSCWIGCLISAITAVILIALVVPLSSSLAVLFTREKAVLDVAVKALHIYTYSVVGFGICMVQLGAFIGLGRTRVTLAVSILRIWLLRYLFILATERFLGVYSVFWGNLFSNYACALITTVMVLKANWESGIVKKEGPKRFIPAYFHKRA